MQTSDAAHDKRAARKNAARDSGTGALPPADAPQLSESHGDPSSANLPAVPEHAQPVPAGTLSAIRAIAVIVLDSLDSPHSRRAYEKALSDFLAWYVETGRPGLSKATVQRYKTVLQQSGLAPATINQRLSAIRKLVQEAADNGLIDPALAAGITRVKGVKTAGQRTGNWLSREQAQALLQQPDSSTLIGLRDRALLATLIGTGLRRAEVADLTVAALQVRDERWVIVDLIGKGRRVRTVPVARWTKAAIDAWLGAADISAGPIFRRIRRGDHVTARALTPTAIRHIVVAHGNALGLDVRPHDLRRTFAKLARGGGAALEQIQLTLGHARLDTTQRYLGLAQDLGDAPADRLALDSGR